jgi:hypothetical protein
MHVGPFVVHVLDAVCGLIVVHPRPRHLAAAPPRFAAAEVLARFRFAKDPPVVLGGDAIVVEAARTVPVARRRQPVLRQFGEPRPKTGVDIALEHLGGGVDMGVGVKNPVPVLHFVPPLLVPCPSAAFPAALVGRAGSTPAMQRLLTLTTSSLKENARHVWRRPDRKSERISQQQAHRMSYVGYAPARQPYCVDA